MGEEHARARMLRLGRPVGAYPRLEARLAAIHLGSRDEEERAMADTGCAECGGSMAYDEPCSEKGDDDAGAGGKDDCPCSDDDGTEDAESDCGCDQ